MLKRFSASQRRGALILLVILISIFGWRWRVSQLEKDLPLPPEVEQENVGRDDSGNGLDRSGKPSERSTYKESASVFV